MAASASRSPPGVVKACLDFGGVPPWPAVPRKWCGWATQDGVWRLSDRAVARRLSMAGHGLRRGYVSTGPVVWLSGRPAPLQSQRFVLAADAAPTREVETREPGTVEQSLHRQWLHRRLGPERRQHAPGAQALWRRGIELQRRGTDVRHGACDA